MLEEQLKFDTDNGMAQQHIGMIHKDNDGYIALCNINADGEFSQHHYLYDVLVNKLGFEAFELDKNYYFSPNTFFKPRRSVETVRQISALYVDLDLHGKTKAEVKRITRDLVVFLKTDAVLKNIPAPSIIVFTGRGLQLYWVLDPLPKHGVPLWQMTQDSITNAFRAIFKRYNIDIDVDHVSDIARVLRLPGTINTKAGEMARVLEFNDNKFRLDEINENYFPELSDFKHSPRKPKAPAKLYHLFNLYSLHLARLNDIIKLVEMRKGHIESDECRRRLVFLYRYLTCCYLKSPQHALALTLDFNKGFTQPLPERTVIKATESAEKAYFDWLSGDVDIINGVPFRKGYNYKNSTLIDWLSITPEEQREMETIIGKEEKYRRNDKRRYGKDENGLTAKQRERQERDKRILEMHKQGMTHRQIAKIIGVSAKTITNSLRRV